MKKSLSLRKNLNKLNKMKTPNLDREINDLEYYEGKDELTNQGKRTLKEFRELKQLALRGVVNWVCDCGKTPVWLDRSLGYCTKCLKRLKSEQK
jgi:hypothetical protein